MKQVIRSTLLLAVVIGSAGVVAQERTPAENAQVATEVRQSVFKLLNAHMEPIGAMARRQIPFDAAIVQRNAERMAQLGAMIPDVFATDTREFEVETLAMDRIWDNQEDFASHAQALVDAATNFAQVAAGGDQAVVMRELRTLGGACGNCHDNYRLE